VPAASRKVGSRSITEPTAAVLDPAFTLPGKWAKAGTWMPPSQPVPLWRLNGVALTLAQFAPYIT
jgi:hypothetical protein